jgi:hypothetical protein
MKIHKILTLLLLALALNACDDEDIFQKDPSAQVIEDFYQSEEDFTLAVRGIYSRMRGGGFYAGSGNAGDLIVVGDLLSDNIVSNPDGRGSNFQSHNWLYDDNTIPSGIYTSCYIGAARANLLLSQIDKLEAGPFKDAIRAEALALRANYHFEAARFFSKVPSQSADAGSSIGVAYVSEFEPFDQAARLDTVDETYALINADLDLAASLIGSANAGETTRFNLNTIRGLISRVALHEGNYARVIANAGPVVSAVNPAPASQLGALWTTAASPGVLFELPFIVGDGLLDSNYSQGSGSSLIPEWSVDKDFYDLYDVTTEPERFNSYFLTLQDGQNRDFVVVNKYINGALQQGLNNGRYLRVEEVILNLAEAQYFSNPNQARQTLDILRNARYTSFTGGETGSDVFDAIMLERRKELAFESSDRWFTLKRLQGVSGIPSEYTNGVQRSGNGYLADGSGIAPPSQVLPAGDFKWQLPIQQDWIIQNPNLVQNQGY